MKVLFLSLFHVGNIPKAPGTWGSLASAIILAIFWILFPADLSIKIILLLFIFIVVYFLTVKFIKETVASDNYDQQWIVVDEFMGMLIACLPFFYFEQFSWWLLVGGFVLFRLFDIWKPLGVKAIDSLNSPQAVILDDLLAGFYALLIQIIIISFFLPTFFL